ncbi:hypothetical protein [Thauera humireducens]|uniref:hypothetical protein n=1 Tax=Thauera humireducens TaxID=1134435 RepID=UPI00311F4CA3
MATGRSTQLTRQIGEHLVASELGRMDIIATPFSGNVPQFDLLASTQTGSAFPVQVKAINGPSWQFNAASFLQIEIKDDYQTVLGPRQGIDQSIVCVLVLLRSAGTDAFYTLTVADLQELCGSTTRAAGGQRIHSQHTAPCGPSIWPALKGGPHYSSVRTVRLNPSRKRPA